MAGEQPQRAASEVQEQYDRVAAQYDDRWAAYVRHTLEAFLARSQPIESLDSGSKVLDVGTGTGALVKALHAKYPTHCYSGVDISEKMIEEARGGVPDATFVHGSAEALPFPDSSFDAVVSLSSLHFWTNPAAGLQEMARVLRPGGVLIVSDWCHDYLVCKLCAWYLWLTPGHSRADWSILGSRAVAYMVSNAGLDTRPADCYEIDSRVFGKAWLPRWGMMAFTATKPTKSTPLKGEQVAAFERDGYLL